MPRRQWNCRYQFPKIPRHAGALIPHLPYPLDRGRTPATGEVLDLLDFVGQRIAKPIEQEWHQYFRHSELSFDIQQGRREFRADVNQLFERAGIAYEVDSDMMLRRLGPPESREVISDLAPNTGDDVLDDLIEDARRRYLSRRPEERRIALEKLWDSFERLKTIEPGRDKKTMVGALLDRAGTGVWRTHLDREAKQLTEIGNSMQIRHFETGKEAVPDEAVDYLFTRLAALMLHLMRATDRLT